MAKFGKVGQKLGQSFTGLPPWARGLIAVAVVGGSAYLIYKLIKSAKDIKENKGAREEDEGWYKELQKLNSDASTKTTLSQGAAYSLANKIHTAMDGWGTDEEAIIKAFRALKNDADFCYLNVAYGIRVVSSGRFSTEPDFTGNLVSALGTELSDYWIIKINTILKAKRIKYYV